MAGEDLHLELRKASRPAGSFGAPHICFHSFAAISTVPGATARLVGGSVFTSGASEHETSHSSSNFSCILCTPSSSLWPPLALCLLFFSQIFWQSVCQHLCNLGRRTLELCQNLSSSSLHSWQGPFDRLAGCNQWARRLIPRWNFSVRMPRCWGGSVDWRVGTKQCRQKEKCRFSQNA